MILARRWNFSFLRMHSVEASWDDTIHSERKPNSLVQCYLVWIFPHINMFYCRHHNAFLSSCTMVRDFTWYHIDCFTISVDQILQSVSLFSRGGPTRPTSHRLERDHNWRHPMRPTNQWLSWTFKNKLLTSPMICYKKHTTHQYLIYFLHILHLFTLIIKMVNALCQIYIMWYG